MKKFDSLVTLLQKKGVNKIIVVNREAIFRAPYFHLTEREGGVFYSTTR